MTTKTASKKTKKPRRKTRGGSHAQHVAPVWTQAVADIVASAVAPAHVQGHDVRKQTMLLARTLVAEIPRAQQVLVMRGHPPSKTDCHCHAYALLEVNAHDTARRQGMPPQVMFQYAVHCFNSYMSQRN